MLDPGMPSAHPPRRSVAVTPDPHLVVEVPSGMVESVAPKLMARTGPLLRPGKESLGTPEAPPLLPERHPQLDRVRRGLTQNNGNEVVDPQIGDQAAIISAASPVLLVGVGVRQGPTLRELGLDVRCAQFYAPPDRGAVLRRPLRLARFPAEPVGVGQAARI
jgi:hypothetical protein